MPNRNKRLPRFKIKRSKGRKSTRVSHSSSNATRAGPSIRRYPGMRSFEFYAPSFTSSNQPSLSDWLSFLYKLGTVALKLYSFAYGSTVQNGQVATTTVITSTAQAILVGVEDILYGTPIAELKDGFSFVSYNQARVSHFTFAISPGAELSRRAGRYVIAVVPLTSEQALRYVNAGVKDRICKATENVSFEQLVAYPGAVTCAADKPTRISFRTTGYSGAWHEVGTFTKPTKSNISTLVGGYPLVKLLFAYQDMASASFTPSNLYSPDEALFQLDISGSIMLREPGEKFIREGPTMVQDTSSVNVSCVSKPGSVEVPMSQFTVGDGLLTCPAIPEFSDAEGFATQSIDNDFEVLTL